jgi:hypothetical protein
MRRYKMKRIFLGTVLLLMASVFPGIAIADVQINIGLPPPIVFSSPPDVVVVPSGPSYVYMVPGTVGLYFYGGYWYRFYGGYWYRATHYSDPWVAVDPYLVPSPVVVVPADYILNMPPGYYRIRYYDFHNHWRDWGYKRHWNNYTWYNQHARQHWAGQEFHRPPPPSQGPRGPYDKGPKGRPITPGAYERGPGSKPADAGPRDRGPRGKPVEVGPYDKGPKGKPVQPVSGPPDKGPGPKGNGGPYDKGPQGKPVDAGPRDKGAHFDGGPGDKGGR